MSMQMKGGLNCTIRTGEVIFSFPREFPEAGKVKLPPWLSFSVSICLFFFSKAGSCRKNARAARLLGALLALFAFWGSSL